MLKSVVRIFPQASCLLSRQQIIPARCPALLNLVKIQFNQYSSLEKPKRFYKKVGILQSNGDYEITLDHRKLKTPNGVLFKVSSEPLALAIAAEWDAQCDKIERSSMHLTGICNTVIDNPNRLTKFDLVQNIINFLETDTILYHTQEEEELRVIQEKEWGGILSWFNQRYGTSINYCMDISGPTISEKDRATVQRHFLSYNFDTVMGINFAVETLKSIVLALACVDRKLSIEEAVHLSKLEEEYQIGHWGRVEWAHDLDQQELQARVAAAIFYVHVNSLNESNGIKKKASN
uniref:ATP synthase mitochondrial F1 complex assembly factor 2 n=1 Tax=Cacopsylla melanoneura TaxID=428564 RepID=A0A8D8X9P7_9HEMI